MSKLKLIAVLGALAALSACVQNGYGGSGINAQCTTMGALGGAALGAVTDNNIAESAIVGGAAGALAGSAGYCQ